jgi:hypothetical protein
MLFLKTAFLLQNESFALEFNMHSTLRAIATAKSIAKQLAKRARVKRRNKRQQDPGNQGSLSPRPLDVG